MPHGDDIATQRTGSLIADCQTQKKLGETVKAPYFLLFWASNIFHCNLVFCYEETFPVVLFICIKYFCCIFLFCYEEAFPIDYSFSLQTICSKPLPHWTWVQAPGNWFHLLGERGYFTTMALPPSSVFVGSVVSCYCHWGATGTKTNLPAGYPHPEELLKISASKLRLCGPRMELFIMNK